MQKVMKRIQNNDLLKFLIKNFINSTFTFVIFFLVISSLKAELINKKINYFLYTSNRVRIVIFVICLGLCIILLISKIIVWVKKEKIHIDIVLKESLLILLMIIQCFVFDNKTFFKVEIYFLLTIALFMLVQIFFILYYYVRKGLDNKENMDYDRIILLTTIVSLVTGIIIGII